MNAEALKRLISLILQRVLLVGLITLIWSFAASRAPSYILPGPGKVLTAIVTLWHGDSFLQDLCATFKRVCIGFALATLIGAPLGLALGSSKLLGRFFAPVLSVLNSVSSAIWAIFAILWFGISDWAPAFVVFTTSLPLILTNVWRGAQTVDRQYIDLARSLRMSRQQILLKIHLPTILPFLVSGAHMAFGFGWRVSLVAETLGASNGVGYRLRQAADLVQSDVVFAWTVCIVALMLLLEALVLTPLESRMFRWKIGTP